VRALTEFAPDGTILTAIRRLHGNTQAIHAGANNGWREF